jgi:hypothetical protein
LSTAEAEYVAASNCAQDVIWILGVQCDLNYQQGEPTVTFEDKTAAIKWSFSSSHRQSIFISKYVLSKKSCQ